VRQRRLADAGQVFDQQMAARQQAGERQADLRLLPRMMLLAAARIRQPDRRSGGCRLAWLVGWGDWDDNKPSEATRYSFIEIVRSWRRPFAAERHTVTSTAFITHRDCHLHDMGSYHPEAPERLSAISDHLIAQGLDSYFVYHDAPLATFAAAQTRAHGGASRTSEARLPRTRHRTHLDPDTAMNRTPGRRRCAPPAPASGGRPGDVRRSSRMPSVPCARPVITPSAATAMGFCFFNNIAVAAAHALAGARLSRVAVIDFDVHHGNGTEDCFKGDPRVLMVSTFQHPFYPYSGTEHPAANMCNVPLPRGSDGEEFRTW
jgi:hypothetical protein